jgi:hypothetical protein
VEVGGELTISELKDYTEATEEEQASGLGWDGVCEGGGGGSYPRGGWWASVTPAPPDCNLVFHKYTHLHPLLKSL